MSTSSKQETTNSPPDWAKPLFEQSASEAKTIYDSGAGGNVYQGQTVAGLGDLTKSGIGGVANTAQNWNTGKNTYDKFGQIGNNAAQVGNTLAGQVGGIANGRNGITTEADYRNILKQTQAPTSAQNNLAEMASGSFLKEGNPYFNEMLGNQMDKTAARIQSQFAGSGRYGSGANTSVLSNELGALSTNALYNQYNQDTQNMLAANGMIDASNATRLGQQTAAVQGITGAQGQNIANQLSATGLQGNLLNTALGTQMDATKAQYGADQQGFQNQMASNQALIQAGQLEDANKQAQLTADFTKWQSEDMQPWTRLGLLQAAAAGAAGNYGTNTQTVSQGINPLSALGGIGSLATKSDVRAKVGIVPIGIENGHTVYEYCYRGSRVRWIGVMAQEVIEKDPLAVTITPDGLFAVNYDRIGVKFRRAA